jgi:hypothetical protein
MHRRPLPLLTCLALLAAACSQGGTGMAPTADLSAPDLAVAIDLLPPADLTPRTPEVAPLNTGPVLAAVELVTVTYQGYLYQPDVEGFGDWVVGSDWYKQVGADFGVGPGRHLAKVELPDAAPNGVFDRDVQNAIRALVAAGTLPAPPQGQQSQLLYMMYYPAETAITQRDGSVLCTQFAGYHGSLTFPGGARATYAVIGDCPGGGIDGLTVTASHELIEAATDPWVNTTSPGYFLAADLPDHFAVEAGQEMGDLCEFLDGLRQDIYQVTRVWSPAAALALREPCIPWPTTDYETVVVTPAEAPMLSPGQTFSFVLTGWSSNPHMASWTLSLNEAPGTEFSLRAIDAKLASTGISHGFSVRLTVTVPPDAYPPQVGGIEVLSGPNRHVAPVAFQVM